MAELKRDVPDLKLNIIAKTSRASLTLASFADLARRV